MMPSTVRVATVSLIVLAALAGLSAGQEPALPPWKSFHSHSGFSVSYPADWIQKGNSKDSLLILSSRGGAEGVIIRDGQGMISVKKEADDPGSTLEGVIARWVRDAQVLSRTTVRNDSVGPRGCRALEEVRFRESVVTPEDVPGRVPYFINTGYFCEVSGHHYVTLLTNFEGDRKQSIYEQIALRVADSLRADR